MRRSAIRFILGMGAIGAVAACQGGVEADSSASEPTPMTGTTSSGDGDGQGDAKVPGTNYDATAQVRCSGYKGAPAGLCDAGVVRSEETGPYVEVEMADGTKRIIFFEKYGKFLSFGTAQADGTAAMQISSSRVGDTTIALLGSERYEIPDAFVMGD